MARSAGLRTLEQLKRLFWFLVFCNSRDSTGTLNISFGCDARSFRCVWVWAPLTHLQPLYCVTPPVLTGHMLRLTPSGVFRLDVGLRRCEISVNICCVDGNIRHLQLFHSFLLVSVIFPKRLECGPVWREQFESMNEKEISESRPLCFSQTAECDVGFDSPLCRGAIKHEFCALFTLQSHQTLGERSGTLSRWKHFSPLPEGQTNLRLLKLHEFIPPSTVCSRRIKFHL